MAITFTTLQANGNPSRSAMALLDFDGETTVPITAELTITAAVLDAAGDNVNASAAYTEAAAEEISTDEMAEQLLEELQDSLTGAYVYIVKNTSNQYVFHFKPKVELAQTVNLSAPGYDAAP